MRYRKMQCFQHFPAMCFEAALDAVISKGENQLNRWEW